MNLIANLLKKKYIQLAILLFIIELIGSFYLKGYYFHLFKKELFSSITTEKEIFLFYKTIKDLIGCVDENNLLVLNMIQPDNFLIRTIPCANEITKIILLPKTIEIMNLLGTNLRGCYVIENYICNDPLLQKKMEMLFFNIVQDNKYLYEMNTHKLTETYEIVMRINDKHYKWINFVRVMSYYNLIDEGIDKLNEQNIQFIKWIKSKMFLSIQSIYLWVLHRSISFYYTIIWILIKK